MKTIKSVGLAFAVLLASIGQIFCQNTLRFTSANATPENAIQLHWASNSNEVYEIDYANALATNADGSTAWFKLYDDYPSHGTNTFVGDFGNYDLAPEIPHPKYQPTRFYRVTLTGTNDGLNPTITIVSPTNGATASGNLTVTVSAHSDQFLAQTILYVDGQEMSPSADGTNFVINTSEWWNGQHTLFAVAKSQSGVEGFSHSFDVTYGRAVSSYVNVNFENLISEVAFSQPFFEPSLGQTQQVTATFAANVNWTLQIQDINSNTVRNASGSGTSMFFNWDGMGDGGTNVPDGVYHYLISATESGESSTMSSSMASSDTVSSSSDDSQWYAMPSDGSGFAVPFALYPPGFDTNGFTFFQASSSDMRPQRSSSSFALLSSSADSGYSGDSSGNTTAPSRPPNNPVKNAVGTFGICYQRYLNTNCSSKEPSTGWPPPIQPQFVAIDGYAANGSLNIKVEKLINNGAIAGEFKKIMQQGGWKAGFVKADDDVNITDLEKPALGGHSVFNTVNFGLLLTHGSFSTTAEDDNVKYSYIWIENIKNQTLQYMRLADFDFGGSDPMTGLRWMTVFACNVLTNTDYNSMKNNFKLPVNDYLHLLLSTSTTVADSPSLGGNYAARLTQFKEEIISAWNDAGTITYQTEAGTNNAGLTMRFAYSGWPSCIHDKLNSWSDPDDSSLQYSQTQVYP